MAREKNPYLRQFDQTVWDEKVLKENKDLTKDFVNYCKSADRSPETIKQYSATLKWLFCYVYKELNNKSFVNISKRDIMNMQSYWLNDIKLSSSRIRFIKSTMSSLSSFIENILDDEYPSFRNIINKIPAPTQNKVMEKTVMSEEEVNDLLKALVEKGLIQHAFYIAILVSTGVRKAESLRLSFDMFNDDNIMLGKLWVTPEIKTKGNGASGKMLNKYAIISKLKPYIELWLKKREELKVDIPDMFVIKKEGKWQPATIVTLDSWVRTIENILGYRFYSHNLRHHYVTQLLVSGLPLDVVKELVGHMSSTVTSLYDDRDKEDKISEFINNIDI